MLIVAYRYVTQSNYIDSTETKQNSGQRHLVYTKKWRSVCTVRQPLISWSLSRGSDAFYWPLPLVGDGSCREEI